MSYQEPILEVFESGEPGRWLGWVGVEAGSGVRSLRIMEDRVELVDPSEEGLKENSIPLDEVVHVSVKPWYLMWCDLLVASRSEGIRISPLDRTDAEHVRDLIQSRMSGGKGRDDEPGAR